MRLHFSSLYTSDTSDSTAPRPPGYTSWNHEGPYSDEPMDPTCHCSRYILDFEPRTVFVHPLIGKGRGKMEDLMEFFF